LIDEKLDDKRSEAFELRKMVGNPRQSGEWSETLCYLDSGDMKITQVFTTKDKRRGFFLLCFSFPEVNRLSGPMRLWIKTRTISYRVPLYAPLVVLSKLSLLKNIIKISTTLYF